MTPRIVIATANRRLRDGLTTLLEAGDAVVVGVADNGFEAVGKAIRIKPDVIITDVKLPRLNGFELARHLHQLNPGIGVVILGESPSGVYADRARQVGAHAYVLASDPCHELTTAIDAVHRGQAYTSTCVRDARAVHVTINKQPYAGQGYLPAAA